MTIIYNNSQKHGNKAKITKFEGQITNVRHWCDSADWLDKFEGQAADL
jgi:hypothetical protein